MLSSSRPDKDLVRHANPVERLIPELLNEHPVEVGGELKVRCPWHEDKRPSLRINAAKQVWKCDPCDKGGDVIAFVQEFQHVEFKDAIAFIADRSGNISALGAAERRIVAEYAYRDEAGQLLYQAVRFEPKDFRQRRPDGKGGWIWNLHGIRRVLYRLPDLRVDTADMVVIVEGEKDVDVLWRLKIPATCNTGGAGKWREEDTALLVASGKRRVRIIPDHDKPGENHAAGIAQSCLAQGIDARIVDLGLTDKGADASDFLATHTRQELIDRLGAAKPLLPNTLTAEAVSESVEGAEIFPPSFRLLNDVDVMEVPDPEWVVDGVIPRHGLSVIYGPSSCGKTTLVAGLLTHVATGRNWFGHPIKHRGASIYVAAEDVSGFKVRLRAAKRAANLSLKDPINVWTFPELIDLCEAANVDRFVRFVLQSGIARLECVVIDTYAAATAGANENASEISTEAVANARRIATALKCAVILIHHTNASGTRERGHTGLRGDADAMIFLSPADDVIQVESSKARNGPPFETMNLRLVDVPDCGMVFRFDGDVPRDGKLSVNERKALTVLRDTFTTDGASKTEWERACLGMSPSTFYRASAKLQEEFGYVSQSGPKFQISSLGRAALGE